MELSFPKLSRELCALLFLGLLYCGAGTDISGATSASSGCGIQHDSYADGQSRNYTVSNTSGGTRTYSIHLPANYDPHTQHPLMISYHGGTQTKEEQDQLSQFSNNTINPNMIAVYPQGIEVSVGPDP